MDAPEVTYDLANAAVKASLVAAIGRLTGKFNVTIARYVRRRNNAQNALLWVRIYPHVASAIHEAWGDSLSKDQVHDLMRLEFHYTKVINTQTGEERRVPKTTKKMSTEEFSAYIEAIIKFSSDLGYLIPMPEELLQEVPCAK